MGPMVSTLRPLPPLLAAMRGTRPEREGAHRPVWFMRQAGRSLPEYRQAREGTAMLDACLTPDLAAEITLQPVRRHKVDAAIFFSDIVVPLRLAGVDVEIQPGVGPVIADPPRTASDVDALIARPAGDPSAIEEAVRLCVAELATTPSGGPDHADEPGCASTPLIGFGGAPFTLAAYLVEGRPSRDHLGARAMMHADPVSWSKLMTWAADITAEFLRWQVRAGASAVQLFDSWAGSLGLEDYTQRVAPFSARALSAVADLGVPRVHFGTGTSELLVAMRDAGADVIGVDHRLPLAEANRRLGGTTPLQGNIDPALLAAGWDALSVHARDVLASGESAPGHVVNLGHGVPPTTDPGVLTELVALVHAS